MNDLSWLTARPIAHRGLHDMNRTVFENTLPAFEAAAAAGYAIECDVHAARDGVPVVFHDDALARLTGREGHVRDKTAQELAGLSVGGTSAHVPTLEETLALVGGRVPVIVELKAAPGHDDGLVARVAQQVAAYGGRAALMSFAHRFVRRFAVEAPGIPCGLTAEGRDEAALEGHFSMLAYGLSFVSYAVHDLPNPFVGFARERLGMPVITWTVRDREGVAATAQHADQMTFEGFRP